MSTQSQTVRGALSVMMLLGCFGLPLSASAQFAPSGGAAVHRDNQTLVDPNPVIGWLPADAGNQYSIRAQLQFGF